MRKEWGKHSLSICEIFPNCSPDNGGEIYNRIFKKAEETFNRNILFGLKSKLLNLF